MASTVAEGPSLTAEQTAALFDILTHHETYREIEGFKSAQAVINYGFPFTRTPKAVASLSGGKSATATPASTAPSTPRTRTPAPPEDEEEDDNLVENGQHGEPSTSPILQSLLTRMVLPLPGVRDLPRDFWSVRVQGLLSRLGDAELSESYDKGALGTRKMLATGSSGLIEMIARGTLGGVRSTGRGREGDVENSKKVDDFYDHTKAEDLERAWDDIVEALVYGDLVDDMVEYFAKTDDLEAHSPAVKAAAEYAIIHLATLIHHIFVLSPEGQYLLKLIENVHNLIPYKMVKQTLRVGNAATMISGMMRLMLAKLSVTSITNWVGLTANADDGMNLLQRIISLVLSWDAGEFRKSAEKVEKAKDKDKDSKPSEEMLLAIRNFVSQSSRTDHERARASSSIGGQSIIAAIFGEVGKPELLADLTEAKHAQCLEYYSALLSVRDRESITAALCRQPPDLFTQMIKDAVAAYEPMIRAIHTQVDLREHLEAGQAFIEDLLRASKPKGKTMRVASVDDYVDLLMRNRGSLYKWVHAVASECPGVWKDMIDWVKGVLANFRQEIASSSVSSELSEVNQSVMAQRLNDLFQALPPSSQEPVQAVLSEHAQYLSRLTNLSRTRLQRLIDSRSSSKTSSSSIAGPGVYISRWQHLLETTPITPAAPHGPVRYGKDVKYAMTMGKIGVAGSSGAAAAASAREEALEEMTAEEPEAPNVDVVVQELGDGFIELVQRVGGPMSG